MLMNRTPMCLALVLAFLVPWTAPEAAPRRNSARTAAQQRRTPEEGAVKRRAPADAASPAKGKGKRRKGAQPVAEPLPVVVPPVEAQPPAEAVDAAASGLGTGERPWAKGVSPENQKAALE